MLPSNQNMIMILFFNNRKLIYLVKSILYCAIFLNTVSLYSKRIDVCQQCIVKSIKNAIHLAKAGDTIIIDKGTYKEGLVIIDKSISIIGKNDVIIDGNSENHVFDVRANDVKIQNLKIINGGVSDLFEFAGIHAERVKGCQFLNNQFENTAYALYLAEVNNCVLRDNKSIGQAKNEVSGGNGIHLWSSEQIEIYNNTLEHHRDGIYLEFSKLLKIEGNTSRDNIRYGMHFMFSSENQFRKNIFENNSAGVAVMYSKNILVEGNIFKDNWGQASNGLLLKDISDSFFLKNLFINNTIAIFADGSNTNQFIKNDFINNGWGIKILGNSDFNQVFENNFQHNVFDVSTNSKSTSNVFLRNFWDKYKGFDLNHDIQGDIPHKPIHFFSYWVAVYPFLMILYDSPVVLFLQGIEKAFPIVTPIDFEDKHPMMRVNN